MILGVKRAHTARAPQLLADLGQIKAENLPNSWEHLLEPIQGASWVGFILILNYSAASAVPERRNRSQRIIFHMSSECYFDSGLVEQAEEDYSMQASAILLVSAMKLLH